MRAVFSATGPLRFFLAWLALLGIAPAIAAPTAQPKIYGVIFAVDVDEAGRVTRLAVDHVIDPSAPGPVEEVARRAVDVPVPRAYVDAVRAFLGHHDYRNAPRHFYTYAFFDPSRPTDPNPDPVAARK